MKRFRGELVFKAHRWLYHSTLDLRVIKKNTNNLFRVRVQGSTEREEKGGLVELPDTAREGVVFTFRRMLVYLVMYDPG